MEDDVRKALAPTEDEIRALPLSSNAKIADELLAGRSGAALDIGCGDGKFTRSLAGRFAKVRGIDVKESQIAKARRAAAEFGSAADFQVMSGEAVADADESFDVVVFSNSLHHIPHPARALREAARVLKTAGALYVMEPVAAGNYYEATKLVNDETAVRTQAYRELFRIDDRLTPRREVMYRANRAFATFEEWKEDQIDRDAKRKALFDARPKEVRARFEERAERVDGRLVFDQIFRVNLLEKTR